LFGRQQVLLEDEAQACSNNRGVDEAGVEERRDEVLVLLAERAEFRYAEVFFVEAPASELACPGGRRGVGVLDL
jgi:hypothetical protein